MHSYATNARDRRDVPLVLGILAAALALGLDRVMEKAGIRPPWWSDVSAMGFYGLLYVAFDARGWRVRFLGVAFSSIPNLGGTWAGVLRTSHAQADVFVTLYIGQTWSKISVMLQAASSTSRSVMAAVNTGTAPNPGLTYEYINEPRNLSAAPTMHSHRGTACLTMTPGKDVLAGEYYTGRDRENLGTFEVRLISRDEVAFEDARARYARAMATGVTSAAS